MNISQHTVKLLITNMTESKSLRTGCPPKLSIQAKRAGVSDATKRPITILAQ